jgi:hypothetical protein
LLDELTSQFARTRSLLTGNPEEAAEAALERLGGQAEVEARIATQLAAAAPLAHPARFPEAHRLSMRALEVLDREGSTDPPVRGFGPLNGVVQPVVEFITEYIVKSYAESVAGRLRTLYTRREAQAAPGSPERTLLARARMEMDRLAPGFQGGGIAAPVLILGGAAVPALAGLGNYAGAINFASGRVLMAIMAVLFVLFLALSSLLLQAAGVAHRRSRLIMRQPLAALWETIGSAGNPPEDDGVMFATIALLLTAMVWLILPAIAVTAFVL